MLAIQLLEKFIQDSADHKSPDYLTSQMWLLKAYQGIGDIEKAKIILQKLINSENIQVRNWAEKFNSTLFSLKITESISSENKEHIASSQPEPISSENKEHIASSQPKTVNFQNSKYVLSQKEKDKLIENLVVLVVLIIGFFWGCQSIFTNSTQNSSNNCYELVGKEMTEREGNKIINQDDIERYYQELRRRCG